MDNIFIFDTNYLYENKHLNKLFETKKENEQFYVTDMVVQEIKYKNDRQLKKMYEEYDTIVKSDINKIYFKLKNDIDIEKCFKNSSDRITKYYKKQFKDHIISSYSKEKMYDDLMSRVRFKKAPFFDSNNSSDKGFKDTLIWMSILEYVKTSNEKNFIFVTNDKGFIRIKSKELEKEFNDLYPDKNLSIISNQEFDKRFKNDKTKAKDENATPVLTDTDLEEKKLDKESINNKREIINKFFYYLDDSNPYEDPYRANRFELYHKPNYDQILDFLELIKQKETDYIFYSEINIAKELSELGFEGIKQNNPIPIKEYHDLIQTYDLISTKYPNYIKGLIEYIIDSFRITKPKSKILEDDLPF